MAFDTHAYVKKLQEAGFTAQQAEAQVEMVVAVVEGNLATKQDIELVRHDIELVRRDTKEMELRLKHDLTLRLGGIAVAGFAVVAAMFGVVIAMIQLK
ncbi:MAG: DUF1640 domain-containing protein [SAR324 cluster bacterium]|nr:DUF1640 domain-containing protein [SAR324 cluster bacterium]